MAQQIRKLLNNDSYVTGDDNDPYGDLDLAYKDEYNNYKKFTDRIEHEFYIIKKERVRLEK